MLKKKLEWILLFLILSLVFSFFLTYFGYKTFCKYEQVIDWVAVSAIASMLMALFTVIAIFIAIYIPQKDRISSSKIELFTQRFETYYFIVRIFKTAFEKGKSHFKDEELDKHGMKSGFLISNDDTKKLGEICKTINEKIDKKYLDKSKPDLSISIDDELNAIDLVFDKYLDLKEYGVEPKSLGKD